ncbi:MULTISPECIES: hypothetical protein [Brasilonema]|uniref:hypothetical protein n=1 Tax=Brasilonema TaxID=383614 RepID=UPI001FE48478|nr:MULTISPECIES: hypothetical protein [Brasilonema]
MTRFIHDQFAKDYLEELLKPYGEVQAPSRVAGEVREIDVLFSPSIEQQSANLETLGLLGRFAANPAIFEPLRVRQSLMGETNARSLRRETLLQDWLPKTALANHSASAASKEEICDCLLKLLEVRGALQREANKNKTPIQELEIPKLWILTPTASTTLLSGFGATQAEEWLPGVHFLAEYLRTAIVAIHQLPQTSETLWLRILGRGRIQEQAINELKALPSNHPFQKAALELIYNLRSYLESKSRFRRR